MSVSLKARPFGLLTDMIEIIQDVAVEDKIANRNFNTMNENIKNLMEMEEITEEAAMEQVAQKAVELISKEYETVFASKDLLVKTLEEHRIENIQVNGDSIYGKFGPFRIDCYRTKPSVYFSSEEIPFNMRISAECTQDEIDNFINEINSEYALNTQEENYIKIKERLEEQGMDIDEEEILENNVIVLTVNV